MFLLDWFYGVLAFLGLWQKEANILFLGRDNARKTALLRLLKNERLVQDQPTQYLPIVEEFRIGRIKFMAFDFGGLRISCRVLQDYLVRVDAVVYLANVNDRTDWNWCFEMSMDLKEFCFNEALRNVPLLVLYDRPDDALDNNLQFIRRMLAN